MSCGRTAPRSNAAVELPGPAGGNAPPRASLLQIVEGMQDLWHRQTDRAGARSSGYYGELGVPTAATQRQVELAFREWTERRRAGSAGIEDFRRAESAYHILSRPDTRARHDRQLGLVLHPAWTAGRERAVRPCVRRALLELGRGRAGRARELLGRAVTQAPHDPHARSYLALALARTGGCLHDAVRHGRYALSLRPREAAFLFNLAEVYAAAGLRVMSCAFRARGWQALAVSLFGRIRRM